MKSRVIFQPLQLLRQLNTAVIAKWERRNMDEKNRSVKNI